LRERRLGNIELFAGSGDRTFAKDGQDILNVLYVHKKEDLLLTESEYKNQENHPIMLKLYKTYIKEYLHYG
jgi:hypothetical protein